MLSHLRALVRTLRWRITLLYIGLLALLLLGFGTFQYFTLRHDLVVTRASALGADVTAAEIALTRTLARNAGTSAAPRTVCNEVSRGNADAPRLFTTFAQTLVVASGRTAAVVIYDRTLKPVATQPAAINPPHLDPSVLSAALSGTSTAYQLIDVPEGEDLVLGLPLQNAGHSGQPCGVVQVAVPMQPINDVLSASRWQLIAGSAATLLAALALGLLLTSRALRPLARLEHTAGQLAAGNLRSRANLDAHDDEIGALARTFDNMADRIELAFAERDEQEQRTRRFIADASHELRTPVTALKGFIEVLRRGAGRDPVSLDAALETMQREAERMRVLVLDLLTLARLEAQQPVTPVSIDLNAAVQALLDEGAPGMPGDLRREPSATPVFVMCDRRALTTMVRNILLNACKYAPGATQTWSTAIAGHSGILRVHDQGPGIPATDLPHVFERFYRGEKTRSREEGGSGLGLSIVQALAHANHGDVTIESSDHEGTTVTVVLPLAPPPLHDVDTVRTVL